jgi:hypothetical protein
MELHGIVYLRALKAPKALSVMAHKGFKALKGPVLLELKVLKELLVLVVKV